MHTRDNRIRGIVARPRGVSHNRRGVRNRDDHVDACSRNEEEASGLPENGGRGCIVPGRHQRRKTRTPYTATRSATAHAATAASQGSDQKGTEVKAGGAARQCRGVESSRVPADETTSAGAEGDSNTEKYECNRP